jgi:ribonucleoside-diphosphate reductase alpha chain
MAMDGSGAAEERMVLSESQRTVLQKYLIGDERSWEDVARRVARYVASAERTPALRREWEEKFFALLAPMKLLPGGSILANSDHGTRGLLNCFVLSAEDNIQDIARLVTDAILTTKFRGGVGINVGAAGQTGYIRPKGSPFADGKALGPCAVLDMVSETSKKITTGNKSRRGAFMFSMHWKHPDIQEFIQAKTQSVMDAKTARHLIESAATLAVDTQMTVQEKNTQLADLKAQLMVAWTETHLSPDGKRDRRWHNANISVQVDDEFFRLLDAGDPYVSTLWDQIAQFAHDTADPGLLLVDNAKRRSPIRNFITTTNPCVTGDTWVQTGDGPRRVRDLVGAQHSTCINGELFSTTREGFFQTGVKPVWRLKTREGFQLRLTGDHRVLKVTAQTHNRQYTEWVPAEQLRPGDRVMLHDHRGLQPWDGPGSFEEGWLLGMLVGDGSLARDSKGNGTALLRFWESSTPALLEHAVGLIHNHASRGRTVTGSHHRQLKHPVVTSVGVARLAARFGVVRQHKRIGDAIEQGSYDFTRGFLRGLFDADGSVQGEQLKGVSVRLSQSDLPGLEAVQRMLLRLGIASVIYERRKAQVRLMPDSAREPAPYACRDQYELVIASDNLQVFAQLVGFEHPEKAEKLAQLLGAYDRTPNRERFTATVASLTPDGEEAVYDCTVPGPHRFDANGLVVHNCGEIWLPPNSACNLASLNIPRFVRRFGDEASIDFDELGRAVETSVRFLDDVLDMAEFATEAQRHNVRNVYRQLGLGIMGWADWLKLVRIPYDSEEHLAEIDRVGRFIAERAYRASEALAAEKEPCGIWDKIADVVTGNPFERWTDAAGNVYTGDQVAAGLDVPVHQTPRRNSTVVSIAPTGSIAQLAGCSWAFEPDFGLTIWKQVYVDASRSQQNWIQILNPYLEELELGEEDRQIVLRTGSLAGTTFAGEHPQIAAAFRISREISWQWHVLAQGRWQQWVDSSISKTINCGRETTVDEIKEMYRFAERNGLKGITVYREGTLESEPVKVGAIESNEAVEPVANGASDVEIGTLPNGNGRAPHTGQPLVAGERPAMLDEEVAQAASLIGVAYDDGPLYLSEETPLDGWHSTQFKGGCGGGVLHYQVWQRENGRRLLVVRSDSYSMCFVKN